MRSFERTRQQRILISCSSAIASDDAVVEGDHIQALTGGGRFEESV